MWGIAGDSATMRARSLDVAAVEARFASVELHEVFVSLDPRSRRPSVEKVPRYEMIEGNVRKELQERRNPAILGKLKEASFAPSLIRTGRKRYDEAQSKRLIESKSFGLQI